MRASLRLWLLPWPRSCKRCTLLGVKAADASSLLEGHACQHEHGRDASVIEANQHCAQACGCAAAAAASGVSDCRHAHLAAAR